MDIHIAPYPGFGMDSGSDTIKQGGIVVVTRWFIRWILNVAGIIFTAYVIVGFNVTAVGAIVGSIILGFINATIRPLILLLTLPINLLTLGLFTLIVNGFMLWVVSLLVKGFAIQNFGTAVFAALLLTVISSGISFLVKD
ncbi:MAG: phage holin family protein [Desulfotomaculaceae bacterium]|nr:phage holin family protein [Desulfotomaculaceae bacterium]